MKTLLTILFAAILSVSSASAQDQAIAQVWCDSFLTVIVPDKSICEARLAALSAAYGGPIVSVTGVDIEVKTGQTTLYSQSAVALNATGSTSFLTGVSISPATASYSVIISYILSNGNRAILTTMIQQGQVGYSYQGCAGASNLCNISALPCSVSPAPAPATTSKPKKHGK